MALCSCSRDEVSIDENIYKGIATRSIVPDEFDWEEVDVMPTPENQSTINLPWDGAGSLATTYGNDVLFDFKKNDGWTLLYNTFTTKSTAPLVNPYFILYNKYNGLLRVYLYTTTPFVTTSSSIESCISVNQDVNLLDFVGNDLVINGRSSKRQYKNIQPGQIDGGKPLATNKWYMLQYEMAYDPYISQKSNALMNFNLTYYDVETFKFEGDAKGSINGTIGLKDSQKNIQNDLIKDSKSVASSLLSGVGVDFVNHHSTNANDGSNDLGINKNIFKLISSGVTNAFQSSVKGLPGIAAGLISGVFGGKGAEVKSVNLDFSVDNIRISGTGQNSGSFPAMPISVKIPGSQGVDNSQGIVPLYNEPLGIFNFLGMPTLNLTIKTWKRDRNDDPVQPGRIITETSSTLTIPQINYQRYIFINPSLSNIADVDVQCDLIADHGNGKYELNPTEYRAYSSGEYATPVEEIPYPDFFIRCIASVKPKGSEVKYYIYKYFDVKSSWNEVITYLDPIFQ